MLLWLNVGPHFVHVFANLIRQHCLMLFMLLFLLLIYTMLTSWRPFYTILFLLQLQSWLEFYVVILKEFYGRRFNQILRWCVKIDCCCPQASLATRWLNIKPEVLGVEFRYVMTRKFFVWYVAFLNSLEVASFPYDLLFELHTICFVSGRFFLLHP